MLKLSELHGCETEKRKGLSKAELMTGLLAGCGLHPSQRKPDLGLWH